MDFDFDTLDNAPEEDFELLGELTQKVIDKNNALQVDLTKYAEGLTAERKELEDLVKLLSVVEDEETTQPDVVIPGAKRPLGLLSTYEFYHPDSPFCEEALQRSRYLSETTDHPMKAKDLDNLADAVRGENKRLQALESQRIGRQDITIDIERNIEGVNWETVCDKITSDSRSDFKRIPEQYRIKWIGDRHPDINHASWGTDEIDKLNKIVVVYTRAKRKVDWVEVAKTLGTNRTPIDCMRNSALRTRGFTWTQDIDTGLLNAVEKYGSNNWSVVARAVSEEVNAGQCAGRYHRNLDPAVKKGAWEEAEFNRLKEAIEAWDNSWVEVATCMAGRTNDLCRERWSEHLSTSSAQAEWTDEIDKNLMKYVEELGNQWKVIAQKIGNGANGNKCKNRYEKLKRLQNAYKRAIPIPVSLGSGFSRFPVAPQGVRAPSRPDHPPATNSETPQATPATPLPPPAPLLLPSTSSPDHAPAGPSSTPIPPEPLAPPAWVPYPVSTMQWSPASQIAHPPQALPMYTSGGPYAGQRPWSHPDQQWARAPILLNQPHHGEDLNSRAPEANTRTLPSVPTDKPSGGPQPSAERQRSNNGGRRKQKPRDKQPNDAGSRPAAAAEPGIPHNPAPLDESTATTGTKTAPKPRVRPRPIAKPKAPEPESAPEPTPPLAAETAKVVGEDRQPAPEAPKRKRGRPRLSETTGTPKKKAKLSEAPVRKSPRKVGQPLEGEKSQASTTEPPATETGRVDLPAVPRRGRGRPRGAKAKVG